MQGKRGKMDWKKELKDQVGATDEGDIADLNDVEGREILTLQHLQQMNGDQVMIGIGANKGVFQIWEDKKKPAG